MLKAGDKITIRSSEQLRRRGLASLSGKQGVVTKVMRSASMAVGAFVDVRIARKTRRVFIPFVSIESAESVNKARVESILKTTKL